MNSRPNRILRTLSILALLVIVALITISALLVAILVYNKPDTPREYRQVEQMTSSITPLPVVPTLDSVNLWHNLSRM